MADQGAGWFDDPAGVDQRRWWDGAAWTDRVLRDQIVLLDPLGAPAPTDELEAVDPDPAVIPSIPVVGRHPRADPSSGGAAASGVDRSDDAPPTRRRRTVLVGVAAALVLIVVAAVVVFLVPGVRSRPERRVDEPRPEPRAGVEPGPTPSTTDPATTSAPERTPDPVPAGERVVFRDRLEATGPTVHAFEVPAGAAFCVGFDADDGARLRAAIGVDRPTAAALQRGGFADDGVVGSLDEAATFYQREPGELAPLERGDGIYDLPGFKGAVLGGFVDLEGGSCGASAVSGTYTILLAGESGASATLTIESRPNPAVDGDLDAEQFPEVFPGTFYDDFDAEFRAATPG